jgi:hypothetical protein
VIRAFDAIEFEVRDRILRIALLTPAPMLILEQFRRGDERLEEFVFARRDLLPSGRLDRPTLERARDFGSDLAHRVNAASPPGVRWSVRLVFVRRSSTLVDGASLLVYWEVVPEAKAAGTT